MTHFDKSSNSFVHRLPMLGSVMQISRAVRSKFVKTCIPHLLCTASSEFANIVRHDSTGSNGSLICSFLTRVLNFSSILALDGPAEHGQLHDRAPGDGASTGANTDKPIGAPTGAVLGAATGGSNARAKEANKDDASSPDDDGSPNRVLRPLDKQVVAHRRLDVAVLAME